MLRRQAVDAKSLDLCPEEIALLEQARSDPSCFAPVYERYFPRIYRYCLCRVGRPDVAEDLTSVIFTKALLGLRDYRGGSVAAWLFRIAHNVVANHLRDRRPMLSLDQALDDPADAADPDAHLIAEEEYARISGLIAALHDEQRELLALRIAGGLSAKEIGAVVGKSEGAVRIALHRLIAGLRQGLQSAEGERLR